MTDPEYKHGFHHLCGSCGRLITTMEKITVCPKCGSGDLTETTIEEALGEVPHD